MMAVSRDRPAGLMSAQRTAAEAGASWSARSEARTNELAAGEQRSTRPVIVLRLRLEVIGQSIPQHEGAPGDLDGWETVFGAWLGEQVGGAERDA